MKKKLFIILLIGVLTFGVTGCRRGQRLIDRVKDYWNEELDDYDDDDEYVRYYDGDDNNIEKYGLGDTFTFDGLEFTFDKYYSFTKIDNEYSENYNDPVIKIGVNIKNTSSEPKHLSMFDYDIYGSKDTRLDSIHAYFYDTADHSFDLASEESYKKYFYILYDGNGKYRIDFNNLKEEVVVQFIIKK